MMLTSLQIPVMLCLGTLAGASLASNNQHRFSNDSRPGYVITSADNMALKSVGEDHVILQHAAFPDHRVSIKSHHGWCEPDANSYSGYIEAAKDKHLFFYFFESRSEPSKDPVVMFINGGPGCSSAIGLFMELGPCHIVDPTNVNGTEKNPFSWNEKANLIFLEQPIGVSFSHGHDGKTTTTSSQAGEDVRAFLAIFFETFKEFRGRPLAIVGESYGGTYIPHFASAILDGNAQLVRKGMEPINLVHALLGNGVTDGDRMYEGHAKFQCLTVPGLDAPINSIRNCVDLAKNLPYCKSQIQKDCIERYDQVRCGAVSGHCGNLAFNSFFELGLNPYDIRKPCSFEGMLDGLCYGDVIRPISEYLDLPEVRSMLGGHLDGNFTTCYPAVAYNFDLPSSGPLHTVSHVAALLERGIKVTVYVGVLDWMCNYVANEAWTHDLEWTGGNGFRATPFQDWEVNGTVAGTVKSYKGLTYMTILGAGHMSPFDKPVETLHMINRLLADIPMA